MSSLAYISDDYSSLQPVQMGKGIPSSLNAEIITLIKKSQASEKNEELVENWRRELENTIQKVIPGCRLTLIGETAAGFALIGESYVFNLQPDRSNNAQPVNALRTICDVASHLGGTSRFTTKVVDKPVPMLQIQDTNNGLEGNILLHYMPSIQNTYLMRCYAEADPRIKPLVFIIKMWATREKIVNVKGKLTGFALLQLIFHYLQTGCKPPVVPALQEKFQGTFRLGKMSEMFEKVESNYIPDEITSYKSPNTKKVGELLIGFFRFYANYSWGTYGQAISIRTSKGFTNKPKFDDNWSKPFLRIEDPFDLKNVGAGCNQHGAFAAIKQSFVNAHTALSSNPTIDSLFA